MKIYWAFLTTMAVSLVVILTCPYLLQLDVPDMSHRWPMLAVAAQITTNPAEPPEFPDGQYCTPNGNVFKGLQTPDAPCHCHMMMRQDADGCCNILQNNDQKCTQYCHEQHCACPRECIKP